MAAGFINEVAAIMEYNRLEYDWDAFLVAAIIRWSHL